MRKIIAIGLVLIFSQLLTAMPIKESLLGTWKLVSSKTTASDKTTESDNTKTDAIKVFTATHVTYFAMTADKKKFNAGGVAKLEMKGNKITETIEYSSTQANMGKKNEYEYRIEGNKLYQNGIAWNGAKEESVWERVK